MLGKQDDRDAVRSSIFGGQFYKKKMLSNFKIKAFNVTKLASVSRVFDLFFFLLWFSYVYYSVLPLSHYLLR